MGLMEVYLWLRRKRKNPNYEDIISNNLIVKDNKKKTMIRQFYLSNRVCLARNKNTYCIYV